MSEPSVWQVDISKAGHRQEMCHLPNQGPFLLLGAGALLALLVLALEAATGPKNQKGL